MPIFRSRHQADLLTTVLLHPEREYTTTELADDLGVPLTTLHREVQRLVDTDIFCARNVGRARLIRANPDHRAVRSLTELVTVTFGPQQVIAEEFAEIPGIALVIVFGSWAARYHGEFGSPPQDVDVLVVGHPDRDVVYEAAERAEKRLGFPVNPTIRSEQRWQQAEDPLIQQILTTPSTTVIDHRKDEGETWGGGHRAQRRSTA